MTHIRIPSPAPTMAAQDWLLLILLSFLWGGSFFFTEIALRELPPFTLVLGRVSHAALILWWIVMLRRLALPQDPHIWLGFLIMGFLNNLVPFSLIVWGQTHIASGLAAILNATTPLFTILVAHVATRDEKLTRNRIIGIITGMIGVAIVLGPDSIKTANLAGSLAVLAAALSYGCAGVFGRRFRDVPPLITAAGQVSASTLMLIPLCLLVDAPWRLPMPGMATIFAVFGIAAFSTALAYVIYFRILQRAGARNLSLVTFLIPVSAILLGVGFLGEILLPRHLYGMAVIGLALAVIDGRLRHVIARFCGRFSFSWGR
ncbi:MAG: DMT family transporter [Pseudomonadota bacterium]